MPKRRRGGAFSYNRVAEAPEYTPSPSDGAGYAPYVGITEAKDGDSLSYKDDSIGFKRVRSGGGYRNQMSNKLEDKKLRLTDAKLTNPVASGIRLGNSDSGVGFTIDVDAANGRFEVKDNTGSSATTPIVITGGDNNDGSINVSAAGVLTDVNDKFIQNAKFGDFMLASASGGQAGTMAVGQTGYDDGTGVFMGDVSGTFKFSLGNSSGNKIRWTGSALDITGAVNVSDASTQTGTTTMTGGGITLSGGGAIKSTGKDNAADSTGGFFLGHDGSSSYDFAIGDGTNSLIWDGSAATLVITGAVTSTSGTIGGWTLASSTLSSGSGSSFMALDQGNKKVRIGAKATLTDSNDGVHLGTDGLAIGASSVFKVTNAGALTAKSATIGNWSVNTTSIYTGTEDHSGYTANSGDMTIYSDGSDSSIHAKNFYVDTSGNLTATSATITGVITATSGTFAGTINASGGTFTGNVSAGGAKFGLNVQSTNDGIYLDADNHWYDSGVLTTNSITATGGTVGGTTIDSSTRMICGTNSGTRIEIKPTSSADTTWIGVIEEGGVSDQTPWRILGNGNAFFQYDAIQMASGQELQLLTNFPEGGVSGEDGLAGGLKFIDMNDGLTETNMHTWKMVNGQNNGYLQFAWRSTGSLATLAFLDSSGNWKIDGEVDDNYSDVRLKTNLVPMSNSLDRVMEMQPYEFDWVEERGGDHDTGLLAQDMLEMMPEIVSKGADDIHYTIRYKKLIPTLINAIQELQQEVKELKNAQA